MSFVVATEQRFTGGGKSLKRPASFFRLSKATNLNIGRPSGTFTAPKKPKELDRTFKLRWAEISPLAIDYPRILEIIARRELGGPTRLWDEVYFINTTKHIIFHMYDDRGVDLAAANSDALMPIYGNFRDWICAYDIQQHMKRSRGSRYRT